MPRLKTEKRKFFFFKYSFDHQIRIRNEIMKKKKKQSKSNSIEVSCFILFSSPLDKRVKKIDQSFDHSNTEKKFLFNKIRNSELSALNWNNDSGGIVC